MKKISPLLVFILALGLFVTIITEMGIVGVMPQIAQKFNISITRAGWLISIFALVVSVSGPFSTILVSGINRKFVLSACVLVFAISNMIFAFTTEFKIMLTFRVIAAICLPILFSISLVTAGTLAPEGKGGKATSTVLYGVNAGYAFGLPLISFITNKISLEAAFLLGTVLSIIAFVGILIWIPSMPVKEKMSYGKQLGILQKPQVWLNIATLILIFAAMFSAYSYIADYLSQVTHMNGNWISVVLLISGVFMIIGNYLFGEFLQKSLTKTIIWYIVFSLIVFVLARYLGSYLIPMFATGAIWGCVQSGGLLCGQEWLRTETTEAPEFGASLIPTSCNLGIFAGSLTGGWVISNMGIKELLWAGIVFFIFALSTIIIRLKFFNPMVQKSIL